MIAHLSGRLLEINPPQITLEVAGVGYELDLPISHLAQLPPVGQTMSLYTHLVIREDAHLLFGFLHKSERDGFRQLLKVSGIGPRIGLALLSTLTSQQLQVAIDQGDIHSLCQTPGIGKKVAERLVLELTGKLHFGVDFAPSNGLFAEPHAANASIRKDIGNALESLGYNNKEISSVLKQLPEVSDLSQGIKEALKLLSKT